MDDLLSEFLTETNESLDTVDNELVRLEQNPNDKAVLDNIFRLVHTIKGTCGFLGLPRLESVAHAAENVLGKFRDGELVVTPHLVTLILEALDCIKGILRGLESTGQEPDGEDSDLIRVLDDAAEGNFGTATLTADAPEPDSRQMTEQMLGRSLKPGEVSLEELEAAFAQAIGPDVATVSPELPVAPVAKNPVAEAPQTAPRAAAATAPAPANDDAGAGKANQSIRVSVDLLEDLMNLVSELVLTRNQLLQIVRRHEQSEFTVPLQRLSQCTTELQEGVMKTRMQPIGNAWAKLPRIIRDLSVELDKKIELEMKGAETELDRQVLELIKDPLTHMVRNSADHGIERPADRAAAGKPETGTVRLNAYHEGGHIIIEIVDDGRGISIGKLKKKIIEVGLVSEAEAQTLTDVQIQKFIFHAGLSTAEKVTAVSGRGVGMDVVKSNIEKIGGTIDLESVEGKGTRFAIKIPLTLAIVSALIVEAGKERFAMPQIAVLELVRAAGDSEHRIEFINDTPVLRLRNRLLPLVHLDRVLGLRSAEGTMLDEQFIIVTQVGAFTFGIVVDQVYDTEEIVVKPVAPILKDLSVYTGNTILGDGSVIMILDPNGLSNATSVVQDNDQTELEQLAQASAKNDREAMLLFRAGDANPKAVPLSLVARLEEIQVSTIEHAEGRPMVQYRGGLMPLLTIDYSQPIRESGSQPVLVFADGERSMGLCVDEILDIVESELAIELSIANSGRVGTAVIASKVTEIIDVGHFLRLAFPQHGGDRVFANATTRTGARARLLLVDDSSFFRNMLKPQLLAAGYDVITADDGVMALKKIESESHIDLIVSDIEMPNMDGFELAEALRRDQKWASVPMVALSSLTSERDFQRGREAGFSDYVAKFDRDTLLKTLEQQLDLAANAA